MSTNDAPMKIFTHSYLHKLKDDIATDINDYREPNFTYDAEGIVPTKILIPSTAPVLGASAEDDAENAIKVHEYLVSLDESSACDERVWSYMAHITFREHMMARWAIGAEDIDKATTSIRDHWFYGQRGLVRNGIARLWWGARISVAPWEHPGDEEFYAEIDKTDRYRYTKLLFSKSVIFQQIMEREQTRPPRIRVALFEYIHDNQDITKEEINNIAKRIDMDSSFKKLNTLNYRQLRDLIEGYAKKS